jgi:hypothetical protein
MPAEKRLSGWLAMIDEEDFEVASDGSPEMAFVRLERKFRAVYEKELESANGNGAFDHYTLTYMNHVTATAQALDLKIAESLIPFAPSDDVSEEYREFRSVVDRFAVQVQIHHFRFGPKTSVALDPSEKKHLRAYADCLRRRARSQSHADPAVHGRHYGARRHWSRRGGRARTDLEVGKARRRCLGRPSGNGAGQNTRPAKEA